MKKVLEEKTELSDGTLRYTYTDGQSYLFHPDGSSENITPLKTIALQNGLTATSDNKGRESTITTDLGSLHIRKITLSNGGSATIKLRKNGTIKEWQTDHVQALAKNGCLFLG